MHRSEDVDTALTRETTRVALGEARVTPGQLDVVELHDAFTVEAIGISPPGAAPRQLAEGELDIGGRVAISASGGLLSMGHPIGPTGVGQVCEVATQLREAGERQHPGARIGLPTWSASAPPTSCTSWRESSRPQLVGKPPFRPIVCPVSHLASRDARYATAAPTSSGVPSCLLGIPFTSDSVTDGS